MKRFNFGDVVIYTLPDFPGFEALAVVIGRTKYDRPVVASESGQGMPISDKHCEISNWKPEKLDAEKFRQAFIEKHPDFLV